MKSYIILLILSFVSSISLSQVYIGSAYYPDKISKDRIEKDAIMMKEANFNMARVGDFAWHSLEPSDGNFSLEWLDYSIKTLINQGQNILLCTPTAAIPKWMHDAHPEIMQVGVDGHRKPYGRRRHACLNNETYQNYCILIAKKLAQHFKDNPHIIAMQIDNELATEDPYCYCPVCEKEFRKWLEKKYKTIEQLNNTWGLEFWSETLNTFDEVWLPRKMDNPAAYLDFQRFNSDYAISFFNMQRKAIKEVAPDMKVTTNIGGGGFVITMDMYKLAENCDALAFDNYPINCTLENLYSNNIGQSYDPAMASFALQQVRGGRKENIWAPEVQVGKTALIQREIVPEGIVRLWAHQQLAYGCNMSVFFPFRSFNSAHEHLMSGVVESDYVKRNKYYELQKTAEEIKSIYSKTGKMIPHAKVAIIRDFNCDWSFEAGYTFCPDFKYMRGMYDYYHALRSQLVMADIVSPETDLYKYDLIIVPYQAVVSSGLCEQLSKAAERGATLIITCLTGIRDMSFRKWDSFINRDIQKIAGIEIEEQEALFALKHNNLKFDDTSAKCHFWFEKIKLNTATPLAVFDGKYYTGYPALTVNKFGKGTVFYVATIPEQSIIDKLVLKAIDNANIGSIARSNSTLVDISELESEDGSKYVYIINFSTDNQDVTLRSKMRDVKTDELVGDRITVPSMDYMLLKNE